MHGLNVERKVLTERSGGEGGKERETVGERDREAGEREGWRGS